MWSEILRTCVLNVTAACTTPKDWSWTLIIWKTSWASTTTTQKRTVIAPRSVGTPRMNLSRTRAQPFAAAKPRVWMTKRERLFQLEVMAGNLVDPLWTFWQGHCNKTSEQIHFYYFTSTIDGAPPTYSVHCGQLPIYRPVWSYAIWIDG